MPGGEIHYKRSRFATRLFEDRLYTPGHYWLRKDQEDLWRVGLTKFAIRMLGEIVELGFDAKPQSAIETGDIVGWVEGFKAVSDLFSPFGGRFEGGNPELDSDIGLIKSDPYARGWLFAIRGVPGSDCFDAQGYVAVLDATIDKMQGKRNESA
ncbi:MAG TPA: glycine cleavage system protein H [Planctomycetota bacterium]|nr:glycine cleavage system protein H [Planctomycetota bacterium]